MPSASLVNYDYIAAELDVKVETVRRYASQSTRGRYPLFPKPVDDKARSPLFRRDEADRFIADHLKSMEGEKRRGRARSADTPPPTPIVFDEPVVGREYIAARLKVRVKAVQEYSLSSGAGAVPGFPRPVTPANHRTPMYRKVDADRFIAHRLKQSLGKRGRLRLAAVTDVAAAVASALEKQLGRTIDLESRSQVQQLLFVDLNLPETSPTMRGPSVSTPALRQLQQATPHPVLDAIIRYRDLTVESR